MNRAGKRTVLNQLLKGHTSILRAMKQTKCFSPAVFIVDQMPDELSTAPVQASYRLSDGTQITESLTYAEMVAKAGSILVILPNNHRR